MASAALPEHVGLILSLVRHEVDGAYSALYARR